MGYSVAIMADSTSRSGREALREMSGRLEEMPEMKATQPILVAGSPNTTKRAGRVKTLGTTAREGSITAIRCRFPLRVEIFQAVTQNTRVLGLLGTRCSIGPTSPFNHQLVEFLLTTQNGSRSLYRST